MLRWPFAPGASRHALLPIFRAGARRRPVGGATAPCPCPCPCACDKTAPKDLGVVMFAAAQDASTGALAKHPGGARMILPSPMHEVMPVHHVSRSRRDQAQRPKLAQLTHDHDLSQPRSRSSCHSSCLRPGWPAERGGAAVISTVHEAWPAARARRASGRGAAARWRAGGPDGGGRAVSSPVEAPRPWTTTSFVSVQNKSLEYK